MLSACLIARDEAATVERIVRAALSFCDECVVCDTGSTDGTIALALAAGARVVDFAWCDDFAAARNYAFEQCFGDWILWLDADDLLTPEVQAIGSRIATLLPSLGPEVQAVRCPYEYAYAEDGTPSLVQTRERFVRRGLRWEGKVHEVVVGITNWITCPEFVVQHRTAPENEPRRVGRNLAIFDRTLDVSTCSMRELYLYAGELRAAQRYAEAVVAYDSYCARQAEELTAKDLGDLFEEPYVVRIDRTECLRQLAKPDEALRSALDAVRENPARAEGYGLAAIVLFEAGAIAGAYPLFLAAAACRTPTHGGLVYSAFYGPNVRAALDECRAKLGLAAPGSVR